MWGKGLDRDNLGGCVRIGMTSICKGCGQVKGEVSTVEIPKLVLCRYCALLKLHATGNEKDPILKDRESAAVLGED